MSKKKKTPTTDKVAKRFKDGQSKKPPLSRDTDAIKRMSDAANRNSNEKKPKS